MAPRPRPPQPIKPDLDRCRCCRRRTGPTAMLPASATPPIAAPFSENHDDSHDSWEGSRREVFGVRSQTTRFITANVQLKTGSVTALEYRTPKTTRTSSLLWASTRPSSGCSSSASTTRKPTTSIRVSHQILCGSCGSCFIQLLSETRRTRAAEFVRFVGPRTAAHNVRPFLIGRHRNRADAQWVLGELRVSIGVELIERPFPDVAANIVKAEWVRFLRANFVCRALRVVIVG